MIEARSRELVRSLMIVMTLGAFVGSSAGLSLALAGGTDWLIGLFRGTSTGWLCGLVLGGFEVLMDRGTLMWRIRRLPFLVVFTTRLLVYVFGMCSILALGRAFTYVVFDIDGPLFALDDDYYASLSVGASMAMLVIGAYKVLPLVGLRTMWHLLIGLYLRPRREERVILFMDLVGSTALAEKIGDRSFLRFLNEAIFEMTRPIVNNRGDIYRYVGDEVIITWPADAGERAIRCVFEIQEALEEHKAHFERRYGAVPVFRFGIHAGPVVVGELGDIRLEIALLGDAINVTSHIEDTCRKCDYYVMASSEVLNRSNLPLGVTAQPYGAMNLKGRVEELFLYGLSRDRTTRPRMRQTIRERLSLP